MVGIMDVPICEMTIADYDQVCGLWAEIKGSGIRSTGDSWEGVDRSLGGNPTTSVVAVQSSRIIGNILCGHDGRTGCFCHVCVAPGYREHDIGYRMVRFVVEALQKEGVSRTSLTASKGNEVGNTSWQGIGWQERENMNTYEFILDEENIARFVR